MYVHVHKRKWFLLLVSPGACHFDGCSSIIIHYSLFCSALISIITLLYFLKMAHIKNLHLNILQKVLAYFYDGVRKGDIQGFKQLLPPAAVCRVWRECMLRYVYRIAYLECHIKEADKRKKKGMLTHFRNLSRRLNEADADKKNAHIRYEWKSNINLIVSQQLSSAARHLRIKLFMHSLNFTDMIHALDAFGFSSNHWRAVNALHISANHDSDAVGDGAPGSSDDEELAAQLTQYFGRHIPNIGGLSIHIIPEANISRLLSNKLANLYIPQLHSLQCYTALITFNCPSFSSNLRHLTVGIAAGVTNRLPQLLASPLEELDLSDIPQNFAWWTFIGTAPGHIEFTNLAYLRLEFRQPSDNTEEPSNSNRQVSTSTTSLNIGCRKLHFPKLKELSVFNSPYNDGEFYSMFVDSPLQTVIVQSSFKSVQHMNPRILFNSADVHFDIRSVSPDDYNDYVEFYRKLLSAPSNTRAAFLDVLQSSVPLPIPSKIEWTNLRYLTLQTNIHLRSIIQIASQLPKLHTLIFENAVDEPNEAGTNLQAILRGSLTQMPSIATSIKSLSIYSPPRLPLVFSLDIMCYLVILVHSLYEVVVPDMYVSDIKEFAARHANMLSHLRSIRVRGTF